MTTFTRRERQRIVDEYLAASGARYFVPRDFLVWLRERPDHPVYQCFYGMTDEAAALAHRSDLVRRWVAGLRITIHDRSPTATRVSVCVPAMVSPAGHRRAGGGYVPVGDEESLAELRRQAATSLGSWVERYGGVLTLADVDVGPIAEIVRQLESGADVMVAA